MSVECCGVGLGDVIPPTVAGWLLGTLTVCVIELILAPRKRGSFRSALTGLAACLLLADGTPHSYLGGLCLGNLLLTLFVTDKTRRQWAGLLLQTLVPALLVGSAVRILILLAQANTAPVSVFLLSVIIPVALTLWAVPYGKRLYWQGSWGPPHPLDAPPGRREGDWWKMERRTLLPGQSPKRGIVLWLAGWLCCGLSLGVSSWGFVRIYQPDAASAGVSYAVATLSLGAFNSSRKLFLRGRRHLTPAIISPQVLRSGSYVLYLRSFTEDAMRSELKENAYNGGSTHDVLGELLFAVLSSRDEEEYLADALRPVGPLVAVGSPGEYLPFAGALRMYLPRTSWHEPVADLMRRARLVTVTLGTSAGTMWELSEAMLVVPPQRLILLVPGTMRQSEYEMIRKKNEETLRDLPGARKQSLWKDGTPPSLPEFDFGGDWSEPISALIRFDADWEAVATRVGNTQLPWRNLFTGVIRGLRPAFEQLAAYEGRTRRYFR